MIFKRHEWHIIVRLIPLLLLTVLSSLLLNAGGHWSLFLLIPFGVYLIRDMLRFQTLPFRELEQFVAAVQYRDFSRHFAKADGSSAVQNMRTGFNQINTTFQEISKEKEAQYQYLQKMLELIDTGILSYEEESGEVNWMNETWKQLLLMPHLKQVQAMEKRNAKLYEEVLALKAGESKVVRMQVEQDTYKVMLQATVFLTEGKQYKLIACKNVSDALDATESKAWQELLNVLTHEIMNSIAPISSLADTLKRQLQQAIPKVNSETLALSDLELGVDTIKSRSEGLLQFAQTYSQLNKITSLQLKQIFVHEVLENIFQLMEPSMEQKQIELQLILKDPRLMLEADINLVEQVLINLLINAKEAVKEKTEAKIVLSAYQSSKGRTIIKVADNGKGIPEALWDKIFIPFCSSRKNGSGIGLSLCKQIMLLHKGNIQVQSVEGEGTAFLLYF